MLEEVNKILQEINNKIDEQKINLAREIDSFTFYKVCTIYNKEFASKYGVTLDPKKLEEIVRKGLMFDAIADEKGIGSVYGIKTRFYEENEKLKKENEIIKKALMLSCEKITVLMPTDVNFITGEIGTYYKDPNKMYDFFINEVILNKKEK